MNTIVFRFSLGCGAKSCVLTKKTNDFKMYQLIDVSQGGISFKSHNARVFKRSDQFYILEVEAEVLEETLMAIVRYMKPMDEFGIDYKVGVEFIDKI
jgi:hypothetical protein